MSEDAPTWPGSPARRCSGCDRSRAAGQFLAGRPRCVTGPGRLHGDTETLTRRARASRRRVWRSTCCRWSTNRNPHRQHGGARPFAVPCLARLSLSIDADRGRAPSVRGSERGAVGDRAVRPMCGPSIPAQDPLTRAGRIRLNTRSDRCRNSSPSRKPCGDEKRSPCWSDHHQNDRRGRNRHAGRVGASGVGIGP